jgi:hypothetical protein
VIDLDDQLWRAFVTGPPMAGVFAVIAALIALAAAHGSARVARDAAARQEWWDRAEWALGLATSDVHVDRIIGGRALEGLAPDATRSEMAMIIAVQNVVTPPGSSGPAVEKPRRPMGASDRPRTDLDTPARATDNVRRRFPAWLKKNCA